MSEIDELAAEALTRYPLSRDATAELCNVSENHTYRVEDGERCYALRVHRPGYRTAQQIASELHWSDALRDDGAVDTPVTVDSLQGERVVSVNGRNVVLFEWLPGVIPDPDGAEVIAGFRTLGALSARMPAPARGGGAPPGLRPRGALSARMHAHARAWRPPPGFDRPDWDHAHTIGAHGHWGLWQDGLGMGAGGLALVGPLAAEIDGGPAAEG